MYKKILSLTIIVLMMLVVCIPIYAASAVTITFNFQGGSAGTSEIYLQSQNATLPEITIPTRRGYSFKGYFEQASGKGVQYYNPNGKPTTNKELATNMVLYAYWQVQSYTITYKNMEGVQVGVLPARHTYGANTAIQTPAKEGYTFFGWQVNESPVSQQNLTLGKYDFSENVLLTAVWNKALLVTRNNTATQTVIISDSDLRNIFYSQVFDSGKGITAYDLNSERVEIVMTASDANNTAEGAAQVIDLAQGDIMRLYDFSIRKEVTKQNQDHFITQLHEVPTTVQVDIALCEELAAKTGYRVYRFHNGEAQAIPVGPIINPTQQQEYFTVSEDGLILSVHSRRLSTYAIVANSKSVTSENTGANMDVQAKMVVSSYGAVYKMDIVWGEMKFYYSKDAIWNTELHTYDEKSKFEWQEKMSYENGNNLVKVYSHSNADAIVSMYVTNPQLPNVDIDINTTNKHKGVVAENMLLSKVASEGQAANFVEGYVRLTGTPDNWEDLENQTENNGFTKIANIAVTITHINSPLTPKS